MALIDAQTWSRVTGRTLSGADLDSLGAIAAGVSAAAVRATGQNIEAATYDEVYDAPLGPHLRLRQGPVTSVTGVWRNLSAKGDPALLTGSEFALTAYTDYRLLPDDKPGDFAWPATLEYLAGSAWGYARLRPPERQTARLIPCPGSVRVTYAAGFAVVPDDLQAALAQAVTLLLGQRKRGAPVTSESLNGYSYSLAEPYTTSSVLMVPQVWDVLKHFAPGRGVYVR